MEGKLVCQAFYFPAIKNAICCLTRVPHKQLIGNKRELLEDTKYGKQTPLIGVQKI
jgi:hypothetical protein